MTWEDDIRNFCEVYNIPHEYLARVISDSKVVPMIRGKAFEFTVMRVLQQMLPAATYNVEKKKTNPQLSITDEDLTITDRKHRIDIRIECKLAKKGSYSFNKSRKQSKIQVKCMRSRTSGETVVTRQAAKHGISKELQAIHSDQYRPGVEFDIVVTTIGNAFYDTNEDLGFEWKPTTKGT